MVQVRRRQRVRFGRVRRNEEVVRVVVKQCGEWYELDLTSRAPIGGTQNGDGFAGVAMSAVHEGEVVVERCLPERVEIGAMAGKQRHWSASRLLSGVFADALDGGFVELGSALILNYAAEGLFQKTAGLLALFAGVAARFEDRFAVRTHEDFYGLHNAPPTLTVNLIEPSVRGCS